MYKRSYIALDNIRVDEFAYSKGISKKALKDIKMKGDILVNGNHQTVRYILHPGDEVSYIYPPEENLIPPIDIPLKIVYEDDYLMVIDKQKDIACIPTRSHINKTIANAISYYYKSISLDSTVHLVNRLDKETSGLMIVAKYRDIHDLMCKDITHICRKYRVHVGGCLEGEGTITLPIYKQERQMQRIIDKRGQYACTHYKSLYASDHKSYIECCLETGRTHQIRVHLSAIGHALVGDDLYGGDLGEFDLTSIMVAFVHPITKSIKVIRKCRKITE